MSLTEINQFPVSALAKRYGLTDLAVFERFSNLGIQPQKVDNRLFVTSAQLMALDVLQNHLLAGGTLRNFSLSKAQEECEAVETAFANQELVSIEKVQSLLGTSAIGEIPHWGCFVFFRTKGGWSVNKLARYHSLFQLPQAANKVNVASLAN